jgi:hypothetical protein
MRRVLLSSRSSENPRPFEVNASPDVHRRCRVGQRLGADAELQFW